MWLISFSTFSVGFPGNTNRVRSVISLNFHSCIKKHRNEKLVRNWYFHDSQRVFRDFCWVKFRCQVIFCCHSLVSQWLHMTPTWPLTYPGTASCGKRSWSALATNSRSPEKNPFGWFKLWLGEFWVNFAHKKCTKFWVGDGWCHIMTDLLIVFLSGALVPFHG